jgi:undecaprenyl-diphosphatase
MIEYLEQLDQSWTVWINTSLYHPVVQYFMWVVSMRITWVPLYVFLFYVITKTTGLKKASLFLVFVGITIGITDLISVHLFKEVFLRYRPSHNLLISDQIKLFMTKSGPYKGGEYGFISSHAANFGALSLALISIFKEKISWITATILVVSFVVCLSRICLGVHYISDVVIGWVVGASISWLIFKYIYPSFERKIS